MKSAKEYFEYYPGSEVVFRTKDGNLFHNEIAALNHVNTSSMSDKDVERIEKESDSDNDRKGQENGKTKKAKKAKKTKEAEEELDEIISE